MFSVIFDMDGTLLDTQRIAIPAWEFAGECQGVKNMGSHIPAVCGMTEETGNEYLAKNFPTIDIAAFRTISNEYIAKNCVAKYKKGAEKLLSFFKQNNIKIGLASGSSMDDIKKRLSTVGALELFDALASGNDVKKGKPEPDVFLLTAEKMGVKPEDCFVFEDSANGIIAGNKAGMKCIGIPDIVDFDEDIKKLMFAELKDLSEAIPILENLL